MTDKRGAPTRRRTGAETTALILDVALANVAEEGVDRSTLPRVAKRAGTSIGPLYSRFDDADDLVGALWVNGLHDRLLEVLAQTAAWLGRGDTAAATFLERELTRPSLETQALLETLAVVRRYPYSGEVIVADATTAYEGFRRDLAPIAPVTSGYALGAILGGILLHPLLAPKTRGNPDDLLDVVRDLATAHPAVPVTTELVLTLSMPVIESGGEIPDVFLNAALEVIARGGFEHASANRIARAAGLSVSRVYAHFDSKDQLAAQALAATIDQIVGANALAFVGVDEATYRQMVLAAGRALCDPAAAPVRRLRMECALAARHRPDLHATTRRAFNRAERSVTDTFRALAPLGSDDALRSALTMWHLVRNFGFGILALHEATGALSPTLELAPLATALPRIYREYILEPLGI